MSTARLCRFVAPLGALLLLTVGASLARAAEHGLATNAVAPQVAAASDEGEQAIRRFRIPKGWKVDLIAAEPDLANPVAFAFDEQERIYVVETFRLGDGVLDIRGRGGWPSPGFKKDLPPERRARLVEETLDADLANRTVEDRERMLRMYFAENAPSLERHTDRVKLVFRGPDGRATRSTVFADGFDRLTDGLASGVLARGGDVWFANIPHLWLLRDTNGDGVSDQRTALGSGFGVRVGFLGHDLHGLRFGPDGRLYFSIGDRGSEVVTREGRRLSTPDTGAVFRCDPDGSNLEIFATGLRNPQELVFDAFGNLWTGDNNSDGGDQARWTQLVEGGDCGWHIGWQFLEGETPRGPWNAEGMWRPAEAARIGYLVPPLLNLGAGPSGITFNFGTGLPADLDGHFFMVDFRGGPSGIWTFGVKPKGAGYEVIEPRELLWDALPTDVEVGPDGGLYWSDWVQGWGKTGKGRIYRLYDPAVTSQPIVADTRRLLGSDFAAKEPAELGRLLSHPDLRVRQQAQFALAQAGATEVLAAAALRGTNRFARFHGVWGLGQVSRRYAVVLTAVEKLLGDADPEVRAQAAQVLGDARQASAGAALEKLLADPEPRPRFHAALALGRIRRPEAAPALVAMLRAADDQDPYLRHAGVMGLVGALDEGGLAALGSDSSRAVRLAAVVALRRLGSPAIAEFLGDAEGSVVLEAARAINDLPIVAALPRLAALVSRPGLPPPLLRRVLNANFRAGSAQQAAALAAFAAGSQHPTTARAEAVTLLGRWAAPSGRDTVTGLWRPLAARDPAPARAALMDRLPSLLAGPEVLQVETALAAGRLRARETAIDLREVARNPKAPGGSRAAALRALAEWQDEQLASLLDVLARDETEAVRSEVVRLQARLGLGDAMGPVRAALEKGSIRERQVALGSLGTIRDPKAAALLVEWLRRAAANQVPSELELELLEAARARELEPSVKEALAKFEQTLAAGTHAVATRRYALRGGDSAAGRAVFLKEEIQCLRCHKVGDEGGLVGPNLRDVGARQPREYLLESILEPNARVAAGFENVFIETRDGQEWAGTVQRESDTELVLATAEAGVVTVKKADITERRKGLSAMPDGLAEVLPPRDLRDLVEYLSQLKGP